MTSAAIPAGGATALRTWLRTWWPELALAAWTVLNLWLMELLHGWETLPFHFIFFAAAIVYGLRSWSVSRAMLAIGVIAVSTGLMTVRASTNGHEAVAELAEVPMMTMLFIAVVFHVERRRRAVEHSARLAEERAEGLERERRFFSRASHELRTPITIMRGYLEVFTRTAVATPEQAGAVREVVVEELSRMDALVDELLTVANAASGAMERERIPVRPFLRHVTARWVALPDRRWTLEATADGDLVCSATALGRAIDGLLENAWKYSEAGSAIRIAAEPAGDDEIAFVVEDAGRGIPAEELPRIFERFYRGAGQTSGSSQGAGLGLSLVQAVATGHGGRVEVASAPGSGSRFAIVVPRRLDDSDAREVPLADPAEALPGAPGTNGARVVTEAV